MTDFLTSLGCTTVDLMNDYLHILHGHQVLNSSHNLSRFFRDKLPKCNRSKGTGFRRDKRECLCIGRLAQNREIYSLPIQQRRDLYLLHDNRWTDGSMDQIREINVQHHLDVMHSSFVHSATSDGSKYVSNLDDHRKSSLNLNGHQQRAARSEHPMFSEFGVYIDYWKENRRDFCRPKYGNLKSELLNNTLHPLTSCDFQCAYRRAHNWMSTEFVKLSMTAQREFDAMRGVFKFGDVITVQHILAVVLYSNYDILRERFGEICQRRHRKEDKHLVIQRNCEIANWCRLLKESVYHFGDVLDEQDIVYHGITGKWMFQRVATKINVPMSTTTSRRVVTRRMNGVNDLNPLHGLDDLNGLKSLNESDGNGVCLALGKMWSLEENNLVLDVSAFSDYPNEREQVIYGGRLGFVDLIFDGMSHRDEVMALRLFQKIIDGDWFTLNRKVFHRKSQQGILQLMRSVMSDGKEKGMEARNREYILRLFECMVQNAGFGSRTVWINEDECNGLEPELRELLFGGFVDLMEKQYQIQMRLCTVISMAVKREELVASSRHKQLYSAQYRAVVIEGKGKGQEAVVLHFRCYQELDVSRKENMLMARFEVKTLPECVSSVKMYGGVYFPQIGFDRWDYCTLSRAKPSQGCPLFPMARVRDIKILTIEICFQLYRVYDGDGQKIKF